MILSCTESYVFRVVSQGSSATGADAVLYAFSFGNNTGSEDDLDDLFVGTGANLGVHSGCAGGSYSLGEGSLNCEGCTLTLPANTTGLFCFSP